MTRCGELGGRVGMGVKMLDGVLSRIGLLVLLLSVLASADVDLSVIPDSFPITVWEGLSDPRDYRGTFFTHVNPMERESLSGKKIYLKPTVTFEKATGREPVELPGMDGEMLSSALGRVRLGLKETIFQTEEGGWARARSQGLELHLTPFDSQIYLSVAISEMKRAERGVATASERNMLIPLEQITDRVFQADDHFVSAEPWDDDRYYLATNDEKLIPVKIVAHTKSNVWVALTSEFTDPDLNRLHVLRVNPNLLRRLSRVQISQLPVEKIGRFPVDWYRVFFVDPEGFSVPTLSSSVTLRSRYETLWKALHSRPEVIPVPFPTVNCALRVATS